MHDPTAADLRSPFLADPGTKKLLSLPLLLWEAALSESRAVQGYWSALWRYAGEFAAPGVAAQALFLGRETRRSLDDSPEEARAGYGELAKIAMRLGMDGLMQGLRVASEYHGRESGRWLDAWINTFLKDGDGEDLRDLAARKATLMDALAREYPRAIREIGEDYGIHPEKGGYSLVHETERFLLYQVLPREEAVRVKAGGKPVLVVPPYVLGPNILAFLPGRGRSYLHAFADRGIPTYVRLVKDIRSTPAVQTMEGEDDVLDTRAFCEAIKKRHGKPATLNGFCQGGLMTVCALLTGELDGLVDAHVTCASPMDGTRSASLKAYLELLPERLRDLGYSVKRLPNGNRVVDGEVVSWVYKLKSMEREAPLTSLYRDMRLLDRPGQDEPKINPVAAAINHWLVHDRADLPVSVTRMSFDSHTKPVTEDGTLPVKLFGRPLNFSRLKRKKIRWLLCIAAKDDLVDRHSALLPVDKGFADAEVTVFPKGHASIATSWSAPDSLCPLHAVFTDAEGKEARGPVHFHQELDDRLEAAKVRKKASAAKPKASEGAARGGKGAKGTRATGGKSR